MATPVSGAAFIDALNQTFGRHEAKRASHPKGVCCKGKFIPARSLEELVDAPLFRANSLPAVVRFSIGGGNPNVSDTARVIRGLAISVSDHAERYDLIMLSEPVFFAATTESFFSFLAARVPDPETGKPDPAKIAGHNARYPDGARQPAMLASHPPSASFATSSYFSNNAFCFRAANGAVTTARLVMEPQTGVHYLSEQEEKSFAPDYMSTELQHRLAGGPLAFTLFAQLPDPQDSLLDPSQEWQGQRRIEMGTLLVQEMHAPDACDGMSFMPLNLPKGIEPSDDPILAARPGAYAVSLTRRRNN
ncbi:catalase family peroxidase [Pseudoduganella sp. UC29_106]|uniref:catalase family peroxidase n=1 Tax=Pseudoduganella sp. UC29_106 TaxID=3374553 RepID=UPI003757AC50